MADLWAMSARMCTQRQSLFGTRLLGPKIIIVIKIIVCVVSKLPAC